jgi:hypothetical protein
VLSLSLIQLIYVVALPNPRNAGRGGRAAGADALPKLGRLEAQGYTFEPSEQHLLSMWLNDPDSLRSVENFAVTRRGVGAVRWL